MASMKRGAVVASTLMLIAVIAAACNQPYSQAPSVTNTPINPTSLFATPIAGTPEITMSDIANFGTSTALAQTAGTPIDAGTPTPSVGGPTQDLSVTSTPLISTTLVSTSTLALSGTQSAATYSGTLPTSAPVGSRPASYTLQKGEFPYCLARRFDVDPGQLLSLNGLSNGDIYYPNLTLKIPQSGSFPGTRALHAHATYSVRSSDETLYSIACYFGDVDPGAIATANNISVGSALTSGQQLTIP